MKKLLILLSSLLASTSCFSMDKKEEKHIWNNSLPKVICVLAQGTNSTPIQAARYCPQGVQLAPDQELFKNARGIPLVQHTASGYGSGDVRLRTDQKEISLFAKAYSNTVLTVKSLGFWKDGEGTHEPLFKNMFHQFIIDPQKMNLGQTDDQDAFVQTFVTHRKNNPDAIYYPMGVSRGCLTAQRAIARNPELFNNVPCIVLEGSPNSIWDVLDSSCIRPISFALKALLTTATNTKQDNNDNKYDFIDTFPKEMAKLFITSKKDTVVPMQCTHELAQEYVKRGHTNVYLLTLEHSSHIGYYKDNLDDIQNYLAVTHAFYKKYGLPYIPMYADKGKDLLEKCHLKQTT